MWLREDGTPYYVGKGVWSRAHRKGSPPEDRIIMQEWPCEEDALTAEKLLIAFYGRKDNGTGILRNYTNGGEGFSGGIMKAEARKAISIAASNISEKTRLKMSRSRFGKKRPEGTGSKISAALKGKKASDETRLKLSVSHRGIKQSEESRIKRKIKMLGHETSQATRDKIGAANKAAWMRKKGLV